MQRQFQVSTDLDASLEFRASVVYVDNYTRSWLYIVGADRFAPPTRPGLSFSLSQVTRAQIMFAAPPGTGQPAIAPGSFAVVTFADE